MENVRVETKTGSGICCFAIEVECVDGEQSSTFAEAGKEKAWAEMKNGFWTLLSRNRK